MVEVKTSRRARFVRADVRRVRNPKCAGAAVRTAVRFLTRTAARRPLETVARMPGPGVDDLGRMALTISLARIATYEFQRVVARRRSDGRRGVLRTS